MNKRDSFQDIRANLSNIRKMRIAKIGSIQEVFKDKILRKRHVFAAMM